MAADKKKSRLFYIHWDERELKERIKPLEATGFEVGSHFQKGVMAKIGTMPDVFILSLARLPSHSRAYAEWIREAKSRLHIPIVFVDGEPAKIDDTRARFPREYYCDSGRLLDLLNSLTKDKQ